MSFGALASLAGNLQDLERCSFVLPSFGEEDASYDSQKPPFVIGAIGVDHLRWAKYSNWHEY